MPLVLVVDDEPAIRESLAFALRRDGFGIVEAGTLREAERRSGDTSAETDIAAIKTGTLIEISGALDSTDSGNVLTTVIAAWAIASPKLPPASDNTKLSTRNCRTIRPLLAPSAVRIPISRVREVLLASSRFARFAQVTTSRRSVPAWSVQRMALVLPTT